MPSTAVVIGAGGELGRTLALRLAGDGWNLVLADVAGADATAIAVAGVEAGGTAVAVEANVSVAAEATVVADLALERFGPVDAVCNMARFSDGDATGGGAAMPLFESVVGMNLWAQVHVVQAFLPGLAGRGRGALVVNAAVRHGRTGRAASYSGSNEAVLRVARDLREQLAGHAVGVTVTVVHPGPPGGKPRSWAAIAADVAAALGDGRPMVLTTEAPPAPLTPGSSSVRAPRR